MTTTTSGVVIPEFTVGDRLRKARELTGLDQQRFADEIGISRQSVSNYELGNTRARKIVLMAWQMRTGVPVEWLELGRVSPAPNDGETTRSGSDAIPIGIADHDGPPSTRELKREFSKRIPLRPPVPLGRRGASESLDGNPGAGFSPTLIRPIGIAQVTRLDPSPGSLSHIPLRPPVREPGLRAVAA